MTPEPPPLNAHGDIDLTFEPDGTQGYPDLIRHAQSHSAGPLQVHIASLSDVIRSKSAAGRPKDLLALPELLYLS